MALQLASATPYEHLVQAVIDDPAGAWIVDRMAMMAGQLVRTFHRRFEAATGVPPAKAVERICCDLAKTFLQTTDLDLAQIAARTGFGSELRLRRAVKQRLGVEPSSIRARLSRSGSIGVGRITI